MDLCFAAFIFARMFEFIMVILVINMNTITCVIGWSWRDCWRRTCRAFVCFGPLPSLASIVISWWLFKYQVPLSMINKWISSFTFLVLFMFLVLGDVGTILGASLMVFYKLCTYNYERKTLSGCSEAKPVIFWRTFCSCARFHW